MIWGNPLPLPAHWVLLAATAYFFPAWRGSAPDYSGLVLAAAAMFFVLTQAMAVRQALGYLGDPEDLIPALRHLTDGVAHLALAAVAVALMPLVEVEGAFAPTWEALRFLMAMCFLGHALMFFAFADGLFGECEDRRSGGGG